MTNFTITFITRLIKTFYFVSIQIASGLARAAASHVTLDYLLARPHSPSLALTRPRVLTLKL